MEKEFVTYEQALALKELGFDEKCFGWLTNSHLRIGGVVEDKHVQGIDEMLAPLKQQVFRWFREKHGLVAEIGVNYFHPDRKAGFGIFFLNKKSEFERHPYKYTVYEEAENACIDKLIELTKTK